MEKQKHSADENNQGGSLKYALADENMTVDCDIFYF